MKRCWPNVSVLYHNWDSTELYVFLFKDKCKFNVDNISEVDVCFEKCRRIEAWREVVSFSEVLCTSQSYVGLLHMTHDLWLTEWSRLHGYPIDDSLVSSVHTLGYGDNYFLQDDNAPCCKVAIVKQWKAQHDVHTLRQKSWSKAHRYILGRYQAWLVQEHSKERPWIRDNNPDILNQIPTKRSSQCLVHL